MGFMYNYYEEEVVEEEVVEEEVVEEEVVEEVVDDDWAWGGNGHVIQSTG